MPSGTTYNPSNANEFDRNKLNLNGMGAIGTATKTTSTNLDLLLADDCLITDGTLLAKDAAWGDTVDFQVIAPAGFSNPNVANGFTFPIDTLLIQPITGWVINPQSYIQSGFMSNYPAKIYTGLIIRVVYHSVGTGTDVSIGVNYKLHKILAGF